MKWRKALVENWNIGFCDIDAKTFLQNKSVGRIEWLKHPYKDRFFADPFVYKVSADVIIVWAEELLFSVHKGTLVELHIDRRTKILKKRYKLLELDTHLSYPIHIRIDGTTYVYPENSASGQLNLYKYDESSHSLTFHSLLINEALVDASIVYDKTRGQYIVFAAKLPHTHTDLFMYTSKELFGPYRNCGCIKRSYLGARPAGDFFEIDGVWYRPGQNCKNNYGAGLEIFRVDSFEPYVEEKTVSITSSSFRYNLGIHTIGFQGQLCVVDGYGYFAPILGRLLRFLGRLKKCITLR